MVLLLSASAPVEAGDEDFLDDEQHCGGDGDRHEGADDAQQHATHEHRDDRDQAGDLQTRPMILGTSR